MCTCTLCFGRVNGEREKTDCRFTTKSSTEISRVIESKRYYALELELVSGDFLARKNKEFSLSHRFLKKNYCQIMARDLRVVECLVPFSAIFCENIGAGVSTFCHNSSHFV